MESEQTFNNSDMDKLMTKIREIVNESKRNRQGESLNYNNCEEYTRITNAIKYKNTYSIDSKFPEDCGKLLRINENDVISNLLENIFDKIEKCWNNSDRIQNEDIENLYSFLKTINFNNIDDYPEDKDDIHYCSNIDVYKYYKQTMKKTAYIFNKLSSMERKNKLMIKWINFLIVVDNNNKYMYEELLPVLQNYTKFLKYHMTITSRINYMNACYRISIIRRTRRVFMTVLEKVRSDKKITLK